MVRLLDWGVAPPYREPPVAGLRVSGMDGAAALRRHPLAALVRRLRGRSRRCSCTRCCTSRTASCSRPTTRAPIRPSSGTAWRRRACSTPAPSSACRYRCRAAARSRSSSRSTVTHRTGRTSSPLDKLRQVAGASLKAYRDGADTREWRREIVVDYLNTAPLAAAPGYGEINGLGDGLYAWFGIDLADVKRGARRPTATRQRRARAYKHALALLIALRAPTTYLQTRSRRARRQGQRVRAPARQGRRHRRGAGAGRAGDTAAVPRPRAGGAAAAVRRARRRPTRSAPRCCSGWTCRASTSSTGCTSKPTAPSTSPLQNEVERLFDNLTDKDFVRANGLTGERLLRNADPTAGRLQPDALRAHAGTATCCASTPTTSSGPSTSTAASSSISAAPPSCARWPTTSKSSPCSTASCTRRTPRRSTARARATRTATRSPRGRRETLAKQPDIGLDALLQAALDRQLFRQPGRSLLHRRRHARVRQLRQERQPAQAHRPRRAAQLDQPGVRPPDARPGALSPRPPRLRRRRWCSKDPHHPDRERMRPGARRRRERARCCCGRIAAIGGLTPDAAIASWLGSRAKSPRHLAILFFAWQLGDTPAQLDEWLEARSVTGASGRSAQAGQRATAARTSTLLDYGVPARPPSARSLGARRDRARAGRHLGRACTSAAPRRARTPRSGCSAPRARRAQNQRLRIRVERDAFKRMTPYWQRLGFPFERLVPSYATAIGSSSDRPAALADLMGIIVNDGMRLPMLRLTRLQLGRGHALRDGDGAQARRRRARDGAGSRPRAARRAGRRGRQRHRAPRRRRVQDGGRQEDRRRRQDRLRRQSRQDLRARRMAQVVARGQPHRDVHVLRRRPLLRRPDRLRARQAGGRLRIHQRAVGKRRCACWRRRSTPASPANRCRSATRCRRAWSTPFNRHAAADSGAGLRAGGRAQRAAALHRPRRPYGPPAGTEAGATPGARIVLRRRHAHRTVRPARQSLSQRRTTSTPSAPLRTSAASTRCGRRSTSSSSTSTARVTRTPRAGASRPPARPASSTRSRPSRFSPQ